MVNRSDWETAYRDVIERGRERVGDPPTPEQLVAWSRGELPESEAERIRELLAYYPDLAEALAEDDEAVEDEAPILTREQLTMDWELLLQQRMSPSVSPQIAAATRATAASRMWIIGALAPALLFAALFVQSRFTIRDLRQQLAQPRKNVERVVLLENVTRGGTSTVPVSLQESTEHVVLALTVTDVVQARAFRVRLRALDAAPERLVWESSVSRDRDGTFSIVIPRSFLTSRTYAVELYGDGRAIATYDFWLARQ